MPTFALSTSQRTRLSWLDQNEENRREKEEMELRRRIQAHRRAILEHEQRERVLQDMKADRQLCVADLNHTMARGFCSPYL